MWGKGNVGLEIRERTGDLRAGGRTGEGDKINNEEESYVKELEYGFYVLLLSPK